MSKQHDDLEAVRAVVAALEPFEHKDRDRILRWACEKLGMQMPSATTAATLPDGGVSRRATRSEPEIAPQSDPLKPSGGGSDIRSFILEKAPKSDSHFAATVAYYYQFEAAAGERKESIDKDDLIDACRKSDRKRPARPAQVLVDTFRGGLLDRGERGRYRLNSVGENLVAMVLPDGGDAGSGSGGARTRKAKSKKRTGAKKSRRKGV